MAMAQKRLRSDKYDDEIDTESQQSGGQTVCRPQILTRSWLPAVLVVYCLVATALLVIPHLSTSSTLRLPYSPISQLIRPTIQNVYSKGDSVFSNEPSSQVNSAWASLVAPMLIHASSSELEQTNEDPSERLELVQGGYLASLGVFLELHCLRRLYWHMYEDVYFANMTATEREYEKGHARHCIETIRRSLMCQANTALYTFRWDESTRKKQHLTSQAKRQCVKWAPIHEWASERSVGLNPDLHRPKKESTSYGVV